MNTINKAEEILNENVFKFKPKQIPFLFPCDIADFWKKVEKKGDDECWEWTGSKRHNSYGQFYVTNFYGKVNLLAHRVAYTIKKGEIKDGFDILHSCDNKLCVNPSHLSEGTHIENMRDRDKKGRGVIPVGEDSGASKLKNNQVIEIRGLRKNGATLNQLAAKFRVSSSTIHRIVSMGGWNHI